MKKTSKCLKYVRRLEREKKDIESYKRSKKRNKAFKETEHR